MGNIDDITNIYESQRSTVWSQVKVTTQTNCLRRGQQSSDLFIQKWLYRTRLRWQCIVTQFCESVIRCGPTSVSAWASLRCGTHFLSFPFGPAGFITPHDLVSREHFHIAPLLTSAAIYELFMNSFTSRQHFFTNAAVIKLDLMGTYFVRF